MRNKVKIVFIMALAMYFAAFTNTVSVWAESKSVASAKAAKLQQRIDFGNSYIMGQSIKSGSVYLMNRKQSEIKSMLEFREDYRQEILEDFKIPESESDDSQAKKTD